MIKMPTILYFFPELLPYLRNDLLPGLQELLSYCEKIEGIAGTDALGLTSRASALLDDLLNALAGVTTGNTRITI